MANTSSTFLSGGGVVLTDFGGRDSGSSIVLQQDGKIVVAGESSGGGDSGFAVVRYNPDGSLDTSFGGDGKVNTDFGGFDYATSLGLQSDGKILVAGYTGISSSGGGDFALVRYNSDGTLDTSFDGDGKVTTDFGGWDRAESVTVESDGRILVAGYTGFTSSGGGDFAVVRYDSNGTLDATFGANGKVITDVGAEDSAHSVIVQSDNKIVVIGDTAISSSGASDFALVRYNADGSLDTTFGLAGKVTTDFGGGDFVGGGTVQPDGKIVVVGDSYDLANTSSGDQDFVVVRYNTDGTLDTSFDSDGKIVADFGGGDGASSVAVQVDGKIVVTGDSLPAGSSGGGDVIVVRYNADGTLDTTFSGDGVVKSAVGDESEGNGVVVQSDGRILVAGQSVSNGNADFLLMRYNADGSKAMAIDFNGTPFDMAGPAETFIDFHSDSSQQGVTGYVASFTFYDLAGGAYESHLYDDNGDGKPDRYVTEPFPNGLAPSVIESGIISYDVNGQLTITPVNYHEVVSGINHNAADVGFGILDFHVPGAGDLYYGFGAGQGDFGYGRIAYNSVGEAVGFYAIGAPEPIGFGKVTTDFGGGQDLGFSVATQSDGKILVAGISLNAGNPDFALVRYNADGTLDSSFGGGNGKITTDFGRSDAGMCLAVQSNGKILVLGQSWDEGTGTNLNGANNHNGKFALARYNEDGSLDISFNGDGKVVSSFGGEWQGQSVTVQADGKIIVAATSSNAGSNFFDLIRYNPDGSLDTSFGSDGLLVTNIPGSLDGIAGSNVVLQPDGKILAAGGNSDFAVARYNNNGTLDTSFGVDGQVTTDVGGEDHVYSMVLQSDGKVLVAGYSLNGTNSNFALVRYNSDGSLDTSFSGDGKILADLGGNDQGYSVAVQPDGKIIVSGHNDSNVALLRFNADGTRDVTFSGDGTVITDIDNATVIGGQTFTGTGVALQDSGKILVSGQSNGDFALVRYNSDGSLDKTFGLSLNTAPLFSESHAGTVTTDLGREDMGRSVVMQPDGKILVAGLADGIGGFLSQPAVKIGNVNYSAANIGYLIGDHALARYNADGSLDTTFNGNGVVTTYFGGNSDYGMGVTLQPDGRILVGGSGFNRNNGTNDFVLARYNSDGTLDTTFSANGKVMIDFSNTNDIGNSIKLQADGKILVAGTSGVVVAGGTSNGNFALARFNADGTLDTSFDGDGKLITDFGGTENAMSVAVQSDGKILVAGSSTATGGNSDFAVARYNIDGTLDTSFSGGGKLTTDFGGNDSVQSVVVQSDGKILVAGSSSMILDGTTINSDFALARYNADGTLDTTFSGDGKLTTDFGGLPDSARIVTLQSDGKIIVGGTRGSGGKSSGFDLVRYNSDGSLDTSFHGEGRLSMDFIFCFSITVQPDGKIVVAGSNDGNSDIHLERFNADGSLDTTFGATSPVYSTPVYIEQGAPVVLDSNLQISDAELAVIGNYEGATLTLTRHGSANADDHFSAPDGSSLGALTEGCDLVTRGINVGTVTTNSGGILAVIFNANATQSLVNAVLQQIAYSNNALSPENSVQIDWTFSDGNSGSQGAGGPMGATSSTTVHIEQYIAPPPPVSTFTNSAPTFFVSDGKVLTDFGKEDIGRSVAVQADGKILVAGLGNGISGFLTSGTTILSYIIGDHAIARYNSDGSLDTTFGVDGKVTTYFGGNSDFAMGIKVQVDGKILIAGSGYDRGGSNTNDFALARYNADGSLDNTFAGSGKVMTDFGGMNDSGQSIALQSDGKILVAGTSTTGNGVVPYSSDFALARYNVDGSLDTTFGDSGKITTDIGGSESGFSVAVQGDGKIIVVGNSAVTVSGVTSQDFAIACYNSDGSLFKKGTLDFGGSETAQSVFVQSDGKILVAGPSSVVVSGVTNMNFALARYNADMTLDTTFDGDGKLITDFGSNDNARSVIVQANGKILVAGNSGSDFALARYNTDGTLDTSFHGTGKLTMDFGSASDTAFSVKLQADGKILVAGSSSIDGNSDFALARFNADGSLDTTFGATNTLNGHPVYTENGTPVVLDSDVRVSDIGLAAVGNYNGATLTLTRHGGATTDDHFSAFNGGTLGALTQGGSLVAGGVTVGTVTANSGGTLAVAFNANATVSLVNKVLQQIAYSNGSSTPEASVQIDWTFSDGNTGSQGTGGAMSAVGSTTVHISALNDVIDPSVNTAPTFVVGVGYVTTDFGREDFGRSIAVQPDGKILVAGLGNAVSGYLNASTGNIPFTIGDFALARYNSDGSPDTTFGAEGKLTTYFGGNSDFATGVALQTDGKILVAGTGFNRNNNTNDFALARYTNDGSLDSSFSGNGKVMTDFGGMNDSVNGIKVQPDGKILVLGTSSTPSGVTPSMSDFALARFNADGSLDTTFSGDGKLTTDFGGGTDIGSSVVVLGNGSILAVGSSYVIVNGVSSSNFAVATYTADGTLVSTGTMDIGGNDIARSVAVQGDGKIIVVGDTTAGGNTDFAIIRSTVDGSGPDTTFHGNGMLTTDFGGNDFARSVILQSDGKILVAGNSTLADGTSDFALARYNTDGSLDTSFSGDGKLTLDFGASSDTAFSITLQTDGKILVTGSSSSDGNGDIITARLNADGTLDTTFGIANTLDGTSVYVENGTPVVLDSNVQVIDSQLAASGNFNGATLMLMRHSGASTEDHFSSIGNLGTLAEGNPLLVGGTTVGTVTTNSGGTLAVAFNANATQSLVNAVLQQIAYSNSSHAPAFSVQLDWNFSDGNTGLQGTGGALGVTGITTVQVVPETASMEINFSGTPVGVASANETFNDFYLDPEKLGETGYVASVIDPDGSVQLYDDNGDGTPDRYIWTDILGGQPESGAITYGADGTLTIFGNGGNQLGRLAVDSSGHVVGLYVQDNGGNTPVFISHTLTADTNPEDTLVDTFTISGSDTGRLYDDNSDGTVDRLDIVSAGANQNTSTYALSWSDATHYRANAEHQLDFGAGTDAEGRPTTLIMNGGEQTIHWQSTVVNGLLAEVSSVYGTVSALFSFIDTNNDGKPDEFIYKEVTGSVTTYVAQGILRFDNLPSSLTAVIQSSTDAEDVFIGTVTGSNSTPLEILIPSFNGGNGGNTSSDTLSNNALTFDLGISSPQLDANSQITVKDADFGGRITSVTLAVISLTLNGSFLTVPLSGTDASGNPYSLPYSGGSRLLVNLPAGIVGQPDPIVKAWQVNSMNNGSYSLLTMTVVSTGGTSGMDWVTGTSGSDSITAGASSDLIEWSGGKEIVDAGDGYDAVNLPLGSMNAFHWLDGNKVLHIGSATNTSLDVYHITKNSDTSFRIDKLGADGTTVESTMNLSNAESMGFGNQIHQFQVNYGNGQYATGTPWDDQIFLNAANIGNLIQVWGDTGTDTFVVDMGPGYSKLEVFENGMTYTLKGTLSDGNVVELGHAVPSNNGYGSIMFFGTGVNAKSISVNDIETVRFVSGAVILDFVPVNDAPTFNVGDGIVTTDFSGHSDFGFGVTTQPDGKILVAGTSIYPTTEADFALLRYNADGTLDSTFGGGQGKLLTDFVYQDSGMSVALQPDGKILVAGQGYTGSNSSFILARYNLDGTLDTTLDSDGKVQSNFGGDWWGTSVTVQSDGKILVAGSTSMNSGINSSFALIRYNTDGSLDTSFDSDGRVITSFSGFEGGRSVELQSDGKILVAGVSNMDFALVRYNTDGTLDTGFSGDGLVATDFGGSDIAQSVALQSDGKIIVAGFSGNGTTNDIALVRYNTDGSLDTTFSGDGKIVVDLGGNDQGYSVAVQSDGKIIVAGHSNSNIVLLRYNTDGTPDITFSGDGIVTTNAGATIPVMGKTFTGMSVSLQPDGKILVTGQSNGDVALLRYNIDGSLDQTFDRVNTLNATPAYTENGTPVVLDNHALIYDSELSSFGSYSGAMLTLMRHGGASAEDLFTGTGTLGTLLQGSGLVAGGTTVGSVTHNSGGLLTVTFNASATQLLVNAVLQQIAYSNSSDAPPVSVQIDWTFSDGNNGIQGSGGVLNATGSTVVPITGVNDAPTGSVTISGTPTQGETLTASNDLSDEDGLGTISYTWQADGATVGTGGSFTPGQSEVDKAITVVASYIDGYGAHEIVGSAPTELVANVNDAPTFFIGTGKVTTDLFSPGQLSGEDSGYSLVLQPDGKILVAGDRKYGSAMLDFGLVRYNSDGTLDTSFDGDGKVITDFGSSDQAFSVALQPDGKIFVAGFGGAGIAMARYNLDGSLDTSFAGTGMLISIREMGYSVAIQSDGKILVAGSRWADFALLRYNSDGSRDLSFEGDGLVTTNFSSSNFYGYWIDSSDSGRSVTIQSDGKIIVAGSYVAYDGKGNGSDFALARYSSDGSLDMTFGSGGKVITDFGSSSYGAFQDFGQSVTVQSDGKILVAGYAGLQISNIDYYEFALARYNSDGSLDTSFDGDGKVTTNFGANQYHNQEGQSVTVQADGKILVAGFIEFTIEQNSSYGRFALVRYNSDGSLDTSFDGDGKVITSIGIDDRAYSVTVQADGKILVAGQSSLVNGMYRDFALVRYNSDGTLDQTFGPHINTLDTHPLYTENATPVVLDSHAQVYDADLAASGNYAGATLTLQRHGGGNAEDLFSAKNGGALGALLQGGALVDGGITVGTVTTNSNGTLEIIFNTNATQPLVNAVLQQIAYSSSSHNPSASVQIDWIFSDGNSGSQGAGGAMMATGSTIVQITPVNDVPTLTGFIGAVVTTPENTLVAVTLAELKSHGDAADVDGTVDAFVIKVVSTGTLKIGIDAATATAWDAAMNNTIDAAHQAYWTPELHAKGTLDAFTVVAMDNSGAESSTAIQATINVTDTTPPAVSIYSPADAATGVAVGSDIVLTFSEAIQKGTGLIVIHSDSAIGAVVESYNVATDTTHLTFSGSELTINPTNDLSNGTHYFVTFAEGSLKDLAGNHFAGTDTYDFTTEATSTLHDIHGTVTFWKTGAAISGVNSTLASAPAVSGSQPVEFRNIQVAADGSRTIEIWETSAHADTDSLQLEFVLPTGSVAVWQDATGLPSGWISLPNTGIAGQFILGGMGITALSAGSVKLGTLTLTAPTNPQHFELALTSGELGTDIVPAFGIVSDSMTTGLDGLYQHLDMADSTYALTSAKVSGIDESNAVRANDALAALKIAVEMNPNADGTAISPYQYLAADVNHDGQVKAADALNILKMAVQLDTAPANEWLFVPESVGSESMTRNNVIWPDNPTLITLNHDLELNLIGIVKGDVDGSWVA